MAWGANEPHPPVPALVCGGISSRLERWGLWAGKGRSVRLGRRPPRARQSQTACRPRHSEYANPGWTGYPSTDFPALQPPSHHNPMPRRAQPRRVGCAPTPGPQQPGPESGRFRGVHWVSGCSAQ